MQTNRREFLKASGALVVAFSFPGTAAGAALRAPKSVAKDAVDSFLVIGRDGRITVFTGKVDLGTGTRTALAQMAADELDVAFERIDMVMGDTATTPDQWLTGANLTIFQGGAELRRAAASAREALVAKGAERLGVPAGELAVEDGVIRVKTNPSRFVSYQDLIGNDGFQLKVNPKVALKKHTDYRVVGRSIPRVDIPGKVTGEWPYVHDVRLPACCTRGSLRPDELGARVASVDDAAARKVAGFVQTVRKERLRRGRGEERVGGGQGGARAESRLDAGPGLPEQSTVFEHWRKRPTAKVEANQKAGDAPAALAGAARRIKASYQFATQTHASLGPSCAVADFKDGKLTLWSASQATHSMQDELAAIARLPRESIRLVYLEGAGCYGRNGHEDATADAALIATLIGKPVRVQWSRADETARAPKSPPRAIDFEAGLDAQGNVVAWSGDFYIALNHIAAFKPLDFPLLAATETGLPKPGNWVGFLFQNAPQPYAVPNILVNTHHISETIFRSSHLRSPGRIENSFANESFADELAAAVKMDAAEFRLKHLSDPRAAGVIRAAHEALRLAEPPLGPLQRTDPAARSPRGAASPTRATTAPLPMSRRSPTWRSTATPARCA